MQVVLLGPTYPFRGGIAHYTTLLCHHLRQHHQVEFISFRRQYPTWLFPGRTDQDPSRQPLTVECDRLIEPFNPWTWIQTARRIRELDPDLLLLQWWVPFWAPVWLTIAKLVRRRVRPRILFISHNILPHEGGWMDRLLARWVLGQGDTIIVHSKRDRDDARQLLPKAQVHVTALPTYEVFAQQVPSSHEARRVLGIRDDIPLVLFFGFVRPYKGLHYLIGALPQVLEQLDVHLLVAGEFWGDDTSYREQIRTLGLDEHVTIVDRYIPNEEVSTYFGAADVVVLPYSDATQSGIVQMAFGFGLPVVTTTVGGLGESVQDGLTGLLVPPMDSDALAAAVIRYFQEELGPSFRTNIQAQRDRFSWARLVALIEEVMRP
jgi:glycosyltransferase involved in cell wall biosynthesis